MSYPVVSARRSSEDGAISPAEIFGALWRHRVLLLATILCISGLGYALLKSLTPTFSGVAMIIVSARQEGIETDHATLSSNLADAQARSEADALRSRSLVARVVEREGLMNDPEFNPFLPDSPPSLAQRLGLVDLKARIVGRPTHEPAAGVGLKPEQVKYVVVSQLLKAYDVSPDAKTYTVKLSFSSVNAHKAARLANAVTDEYLKSQIDERMNSVDSAAAFLKPRLIELREKMEMADRSVSEFKIANNIVDLSGNGASGNTIVTQEIQQLVQGVAAARAHRTQLQAAQSEIARLAADPGQALSGPAVAAAPVVENLRVQEATAGAHLASLLGAYGERHPSVMSAQAAARDIHARLVEEAGRAVKQLDTQVRQARTTEAELQERLNRLSNARIGENALAVKLRQLDGEYQTAKTVYDRFVEEVYRAMAQNGMPTARGRIIQTAQVPAYPSFPNVPVYMLVIFLASAIIGVCLVYAREAADTTFHDEDQLEAALHLPVLGMVLSLDHRSDRSLPSRLLQGLRVRRRGRGQVSQRIVTEPNSAESETVRHVRTAIALAHTTGRTKILMVTSALPGDGKSTLALMIGRQSAHTGNRVIVIEAEMRRPSFGTELSNLLEKGLGDYLLGEASLAEVVSRDPVSGMDVICAGKSTHLASELLASKRLADLLSTLRATYDLVVVDTPPVTVVADALQLGQSVDGAVLVVRWSGTARHLVLDAAKKLRAAKVPVIGTVLTGVNPIRYRRYGRGALAYHYAKNYYLRR